MKMKTNQQRNSIMRQHCNNGTRPSMMIKQTGKAMYNGIDDFLNSLAVLKERGNLIISGRRVC